jgi:hypothetical protein
MKSLLLLLSLFAFLVAQSYMIKDKRNDYTYYSDETIQSLSTFKEILISFKSAPDIHSFEKRYSLKMVELLNPRTHLYLFQNLSLKSDFKIAEEITVNDDALIWSVTPNLLRSKSLK